MYGDIPALIYPSSIYYDFPIIVVSTSGSLSIYSNNFVLQSPSMLILLSNYKSSKITPSSSPPPQGVSQCPPPVATAILCSWTKDSLAMLEHQFLNCLSRLRCVFQDGRLLPGGGRTEVECVRAIQKREKLDSATQHNDFPPVCFPPTHLIGQSPFTMKSSWLLSLLPASRHQVYQSFIDGLKQYICTVNMNTTPSMGVFEAGSAVERMLDCDGGSGVERLSGVEVFDSMESKYESWIKAYHLARLTLQIH